jgi:hypothetical protein
MFELWRELQGNFGHQGESAFTTEYEMSEVVTRRRLHDRTAGSNDGGVGEHQLEAEYVVSGHPVTHRTHPAGVGVYIAANRTGQLSRVDRIVKSSSFQRFTQLSKGDTRLDDGDVINKVNANDLVHQFETDDDPVGYWRGRSRQARPGSARSYRSTMVTSHRDDPCDL